METLAATEEYHNLSICKPTNVATIHRHEYLIPLKAIITGFWRAGGGDKRRVDRRGKPASLGWGPDVRGALEWSRITRGHQERGAMYHTLPAASRGRPLPGRTRAPGPLHWMQPADGGFSKQLSWCAEQADPDLGSIIYDVITATSRL